MHTHTPGSPMTPTRSAPCSRPTPSIAGIPGTRARMWCAAELRSLRPGSGTATVLGHSAARTAPCSSKATRRSQQGCPRITPTTSRRRWILRTITCGSGALARRESAARSPSGSCERRVHLASRTCSAVTAFSIRAILGDHFNAEGARLSATLSAGIRRYASHNCVKGRKRHLLNETHRLPIAGYSTPAEFHTTVGERMLLAGLAYFVPRLKRIWADAAYHGQEL